MIIKELTTIENMLQELETLQFLYPDLTIEKYESYLNDMIQHRYIQIAIYDNDVCLGLTGCWLGTKIWTGRYLEIDNFVINPNFRSQGIGKKLTDYINTKAIELECNAIVLDAFTTNFGAHKFYFNQGYVPKGFHFVKFIE